MSDEHNGDSGARDRATVALVSAQAAEIKALVMGVEKTTAGGFKDVQRQLDSLVTIPARLVGVEERLKAYSVRVETLEREREQDRNSWRVHWPTLIPALVAVILAGLALFL